MASIAIEPGTTAPHLLSSSRDPGVLAGLEDSVLISSEPNNLKAEFFYYKDPGDGSPVPANIVSKPETFEQPSEIATLPVYDIRGNEEQYNLDKTGFQVFKHESKEKEFLDTSQIENTYYPEIEEILKTATGATKVFIFDHTIRRQSAILSENKDDANVSRVARGPVRRVHIDQTYKAGFDRVRRHLPDEADELLKGRCQIINAWRPIKPILKDPLGVLDARSVPESDLLAVPLVYPDRVGETFTVRPNKQHRWHYLYKQQTDEVLLIKCFDSKTDGRARRAPHSAFANKQHEDSAPRESIEVRALVFHPNDRN